jgi:hypothetical protein
MQEECPESEINFPLSHSMQDELCEYFPGGHRSQVPSINRCCP